MSFHVEFPMTRYLLYICHTETLESSSLFHSRLVKAPSCVKVAAVLEVSELLDADQRNRKCWPWSLLETAGSEDQLASTAPHTTPADESTDQVIIIPIILIIIIIIIIILINLILFKLVALHVSLKLFPTFFTLVKFKPCLVNRKENQ